MNYLSGFTFFFRVSAALSSLFRKKIKKEK